MSLLRRPVFAHDTPRRDGGCDTLPIRPDALRRMLAWLRFCPELETIFRSRHEARAIYSRATLQVLAIVLLSLTPLYDARLLHAPKAFIDASRAIQFGIQIPFALLSLGVTLWRPLRRWSAAMTAAAGLVVALGQAAQRLVGAEVDFVVPQDFAAIALTALLFLGRIRLHAILPLALATMVALTWIDLRLFSDAEAIFGQISSWMLFVVAAIGAYTLEYTLRQSWYRSHLLEFQASRDVMTGLPNRRHFDEELRRLIRDAARRRCCIALLIMDIDHFKAYNDHFGHPRGDECLRRVGVRLQLAMRRPHDFCARIGGEEFAAVWFGAGPADSVRLAEQLRQAVEELAIPAPPQIGGPMTASGGFMQVCAPSPADTPERIATDLIKAADAALYDAKRAGRARLVLAPGAMPKHATRPA